MANGQALTTTAATASISLSTAAFLSNLPARLDDRMLAHVETIARANLPALPVCSEDHFAKCLKSLAILPRQHSDEVKGELQARLYQRKLGHLPSAAMAFVVETALEQCRWFPTIAECLEIASKWKRNDEAIRDQARAAILARNERQARLDDARKALRAGNLEQPAIDALPERFKQILETEGLLLAEYDDEFSDPAYTARTVWAPDAEVSPEEALTAATEPFPSQRHG